MQARDISAIVTDISPETIPDLHRLLAQAEVTSLPMVTPRDSRVGPPLTQPRNIYCIGLNYSDHAAEARLAVPSEPILFNKLGNSICGPNDDVIYPKNSDRMDWELEIAFVIGKRATIADLSMAGYVFYGEELTVPLEPYVNVLKWMDRIQTLPGWKHPYDLMPRAAP